jgi:hypothetical protein
MINLVKGSLQDELDRFFQIINQTDFPMRVITKSAFTLARKKIKPSAFIDVNKHLIEYFYSKAPFKRWKQHRLIAIDGSNIRIPRSDICSKTFGALRSRHNTQTPLARISFMTDVLNKMVLGGIISNRTSGEREHARRLAKHIHQNDLILLDRGYPCHWLFRLILTKNAHFCCRTDALNWKVVKDFAASDLMDANVSVTFSYESRKRCESLNLKTDDLFVRLVKVPLGNGKMEILITSLMDRDKYPVHAFKELYHYRWGIEETIKTLKCPVNLESFSGKSPLAVYQDFYAKIVAYNLSSIFIWTAQIKTEADTKHRKSDYQVNVTLAISKMKDTLIKLFQIPNLGKLIQNIISTLSLCIDLIRKNRSFKRGQIHQRVSFMNYRPAR